MPQATEEPGYLVVRNSEEQYSILATGKPLPKGWQPVGFEGSRATCLEHIDAVWTDLRPLSLRRSLT